MPCPRQMRSICQTQTSTISKHISADKGVKAQAQSTAHEENVAVNLQAQLRKSSGVKDCCAVPVGNKPN